MPTLYSTDRILVTHAGALPRPADLRPMVLAKSRGEAVDQAALDAKLRTAVAETVKQQVEERHRQRQRRRAVEIQLHRLCAQPHRRLRDAARPTSGGGSRSPRATARNSAIISSRPPIRAPGCKPPARSCSGLQRKAALYRPSRSETRSRQFQGRDRRRESRRSLPAGQHAGHDRALDGATSTTRTRRNSSSPSPTRCTRNTRRSSMPASSCRSTIPTCRTAGTACRACRCRTIANTRCCASTR